MKKLLSFLLLLLFTAAPLQGENLTTLETAMYDKGPPFKKSTVEFSPFDTIYLNVYVGPLPKGAHSLSIEWITPAGKMTRQQGSDFKLDKDTNVYNRYFWLKFGKSGPLKSMFSGGKFSSKVYGRWTVKISLDGNFIGEQKFIVNEI
ncbi:MAG: hypothetical protein ABFS19_07075 [Thermodesulfobacteriota bacterium]